MSETPKLTLAQKIEAAKTDIEPEQIEKAKKTIKRTLYGISAISLAAAAYVLVKTLAASNDEEETTATEDNPYLTD